MVYLLHFVPYPLFHVFIYEPLCLFLHIYLICYGVPPSLCSLPSVSCFHIWTSLSVPPHLSNLLWCTSFTLFLTLCFMFSYISLPLHLCLFFGTFSPFASSLLVYLPLSFLPWCFPLFLLLVLLWCICFPQSVPLFLLSWYLVFMESF